MNDIRKFLDDLLENTTPDNPSWDKELKSGEITPKWSYINGCMAIAVLNMYEATEEKKYFEFLDNFIDYYINETGEILGYKKEDYNSDNINEGKVLFKLFELTGKEKYKKAIDILFSQIEKQPRTKSGNFWHKEIYPNQIWLDGLYMVQPFFLNYVSAYKNNDGYEDIINQFNNVYKLMRDEKTGLFYHGYDESKLSFWADKKTGCSENFWTRLHGWYAMALVDVLEILDKDFIEEHKLLKTQLKELLDTLLKYSDKETGMFYQVTDQGRRKGNYLETSGTCAIAYSLMKGNRLGYLPDNYYLKGEEIVKSVVKHKLDKRDGKYILKDICLVAGLGGMAGRGNYGLRDGSFEYYISEPIVENDAKGIATLIYAYSETIKRGKKIKQKSIENA